MRANVSDLRNFKEDALEKGTYEVEITEAVETTANSGSQGLRLTMRIIDGPDTRLGQPSQGKRLTDTLWYPNPQMKDSGNYCGVLLKNACEAANVPLNEEGIFDIDDWVGANVGVKVSLDEYEGIVRPTVNAYVAI